MDAWLEVPEEIKHELAHYVGEVIESKRFNKPVPAVPIDLVKKVDDEMYQGFFKYLISNI